MVHVLPASWPALRLVTASEAENAFIQKAHFSETNPGLCWRFGGFYGSCAARKLARFLAFDSKSHRECFHAKNHGFSTRIRDCPEDSVDFISHLRPECWPAFRLVTARHTKNAFIRKMLFFPDESEIVDAIWGILWVMCCQQVGRL